MTQKSRSAPWRRLAATIVMTALLAGVGTPVWASSSDTASPPPVSKSSITKAAATAAATATPATTAKAPAPVKQASGGFFKSKAGVLMISVFAIGTGYALYSAREDRIRGSNR